MKYFSKEREKCIKESLQQAFKTRVKPVDSSILKKYYKNYINLLNHSKKEDVEQYIERLHRDVSGKSNARFIILGNVDEASPDVVAGELVATQIYILGKAKEYGYKANITLLGFLELLDNNGKEYYIEVERLLKYTINKSSLEEFANKNDIPKEILKKELNFLNVQKEDNVDYEKELKSIDEEYYVE